MNIFQEIDSQIFFKRQQGHSPRDLLKFIQSNEPALDNLICLTHLVRVCSERGMPYSRKQIKRVFNDIYQLEFHGNKISAWNFLQKFCSKKLIVFKSEKIKKAVVSQKVCSGTHRSEANIHSTARLSPERTITQLTKIPGVLA